MLRDPITRFTSIFYYYYNLYERYMNKENIPHVSTVKNTIKLFDKFKTVEMFTIALESEDIQEKNLALSAFKILPHLVYNYKFYLDKIIEPLRQKHAQNKLFVIRQESYEKDFEIYYDFLATKYKFKKNIDLFITNKRNNTDKFNESNIYQIPLLQH